MTKWSYDVVAPTKLVQVPCGDGHQDGDSIGVVLSGCNSRGADCGVQHGIGVVEEWGWGVVMVVVERSEGKELHNKEVYLVVQGYLLDKVCDI